MGTQALFDNTTASDNVAIGFNALQNNTTGNKNVALGPEALFTNIVGNQNVAIGFNALFNTIASDNAAIGYNALQANTTGTQNVAIGTEALSANVGGSNNAAIGVNALQLNTSGANNVALGTEALNANTSGSDNAAIGVNALQANTTGTQNVAIGTEALSANVGGSNNAAIGVNALQLNTSGANNVALGTEALNANTSGSDNAAIGVNALQANTSGAQNVALGTEALNANTSGSDNAAIGVNALQANTSGAQNVAIGTGALGANTTGTQNVAIGYNALATNQTGTDNVGIGHNVSSNNNSSCILLGNNAQTLYDYEIGIAGINLRGPTPALTNIVAYLPIRFANYSIGSTAGPEHAQYYIPIYEGPTPPLPVPEVIIANHSSFAGGSGGVAVLIGFPSGYSAVSSVTIANGTNTVTISTPPATTGYYVYYEDSISGFWPNIPLSYTNLVTTVYNPGICSGLVFGNPLTFTYTIGGTPTTVTYSPTAILTIGDGYQYQQYNGDAQVTTDFQWGGTGTGNPGTESWGEQVGTTGPQTYADWQSVSGGNYRYNSIYKYLYPFTSASAPMGSLTFGLGTRDLTYPYYDSTSSSWLVNTYAVTITPAFPSGYTATIGTTLDGKDTFDNAVNGAPINITVQQSNKSTRYYLTVYNGLTVVGRNSAAVWYPLTPTPTPLTTTTFDNIDMVIIRETNATFKLYTEQDFGGSYGNNKNFYDLVTPGSILTIPNIPNFKTTLTVVSKNTTVGTSYFGGFQYIIYNVYGTISDSTLFETGTVNSITITSSALPTTTYNGESVFNINPIFSSAFTIELGPTTDSAAQTFYDSIVLGSTLTSTETGSGSFGSFGTAVVTITNKNINTDYDGEPPYISTYVINGT
jgi:hypothetical protein